MGQIECAAQRVTKFVMQGHVDPPQNGPTGPCATQSCFARHEVGRLPEHPGQTINEGFKPLDRHCGCFTRSIGRIQRLCRVGHRIQRRCDRHWHRKRPHQLRIVQDDLWQNAWVAQGGFDTLFRLAEDWRAFTACIGRWDHDLWQAGSKCNRFA